MPQSTSSEPATTGTLELPGLVVTPEWLAANLEHPALRVLDVRDAESYDEGHIPNAVQVSLQDVTGIVDGVPGMLLPAEQFAETLGHLGVDQDRTVVIYDDNWGMPGARVLWAMARYGHENAAVLTGGWDRWEEEGFPQSGQPFRPEPARFVPQQAEDQLAERAWLLQRQADPDLVLLDTRTPKEYEEGHLPDAVCWDWMNAVPMGSWDAFRPAEQVQAELEELGVTPDKEVVTYCRSGARAAHTYLLLRSLGYPRVRVYDGSWLEWSLYDSRGDSHDDSRNNDENNEGGTH